MKEHKRDSNCSYQNKCNSKLYRAMREKGKNNWDIAPLAEVWEGSEKDLSDLEKYYFRLLKPDLNTLVGSSSDKKREYDRKRAARSWTCPTCLTVLNIGHKWQHSQTNYHKAIDSFLFDLE